MLTCVLWRVQLRHVGIVLIASSMGDGADGVLTLDWILGVRSTDKLRLL